MADLFISYRRAEFQGGIGDIRKVLEECLPGTTIFHDLDHDSIPPGEAFRDDIVGAIEECPVTLVLMGRNWAQGNRILEAQDVVRLEAATALRLRKESRVVIPILFDGASMPNEADLPEELRPLRQLNAFSVSPKTLRDDLRGLCRDSLRGLAPKDTYRPFATQYQKDVLVLVAEDDCDAEGEWVTQLCRRLEERLNSELKTQNLRVHCAYEPPADERGLARYSKHALLEAAVLVPIVTRHFLASRWCGSGGAALLHELIKPKASGGNRTVIPVWADGQPLHTLLPEPLAGSLGTIRGERFAVWSSGTWRPLLLPPPEDRKLDEEYFARIVHLGLEIATALKRNPGTAANDGVKGKVFLALSSAELDVTRERIRRELRRTGFEVLPARHYPGAHPRDFRQGIEQDLEQCAGYIQAVTAYRGSLEPWLVNGADQIQYEAARDKLPSDKIVVWWDEAVPFGAVDDPAHSQLIAAMTDHLQRTSITAAIATLMQCTVQRPAQPASANGQAVALYLSHVPEDEKFAKDVSVFLRKENIGYYTPPKDQDQRTRSGAMARIFKDQNLRACVYLWGEPSAAEKLKSRIPDERTTIQRRAGQGRALRFGLFEGPPLPKDDPGFFIPDITTIRSSDELMSFVDSLR